MPVCVQVEGHANPGVPWLHGSSLQPSLHAAASPKLCWGPCLQLPTHMHTRALTAVHARRMQSHTHTRHSHTHTHIVSHTHTHTRSGGKRAAGCSQGGACHTGRRALNPVWIGCGAAWRRHCWGGSLSRALCLLSTSFSTVGLAPMRDVMLVVVMMRGFVSSALHCDAL